MEKTINDKNRLIGEFMGWELVNISDEPEDKDFDCWVFKNKTTGAIDSGIDGQFFNEKSTLDFHSDWTLLMSVVEKIKELKFPVNFYQSHVQNTVTIYQMKNDHYLIRVSDTIKKPIEILWEAVSEFIEYYNANVK